MTYFRMGDPHYHRRAAVSRSCSGWEGVVPAGYGRQALAEVRSRKTEVGNTDLGATLTAEEVKRVAAGKHANA